MAVSVRTARGVCCLLPHLLLLLYGLYPFLRLTGGVRGRPLLFPHPHRHRLLYSLFPAPFPSLTSGVPFPFPFPHQHQHQQNPSPSMLVSPLWIRFSGVRMCGGSSMRPLRYRRHGPGGAISGALFSRRCAYLCRVPNVPDTTRRGTVPIRSA